MDIIQSVSTLVSLGLLLAIIELIRRNRLKEKYSLTWLFSSLVMLFFSLSRKSLEYVAILVGVYYPPSFIFVLGLFFLIIINVHFSMVISELFEKNKKLAQEIAIMKEEVKKSTR